MNYLEIAQFVASAVFLTIAAIHFLVWLRAHRELMHLLFAVTATAAAANAIAEAFVYRANSIEAMSFALQYYVTTSGFWAIATTSFIVSYAHLRRIEKYIATIITAVLLIAVAINWFSPSSFLYREA